MAKLRKMLDSATIASLRGVIDVYWWKTIPCARAWPKKARQPGTPLQQTTWNAFREATAYRKAMPAPIIQLWNALPVPPTKVQRDALKAHTLSLAYRHALPVLPLNLAAERSPEPPGALPAFRVTLEAPPDFDHTALSWFFEASPLSGPLLTWNRAGIRVRRDRYADQLYKANVARARTPHAAAWDAPTTSYLLTAPEPSPAYNLHARATAAHGQPLFVIPPFRVIA